GKSCVLTGTIVKGNVRVGKGASLIVTDGTLQGAVRVAPNGYLDTTSTNIADTVVVRDGYGAYLNATSLQGGVVARPGQSTVNGFVDIDGSTVAGNVVSRSAQVRIEGAQVSGNVTTNGAGYTDVYSSFVDGRVRAEGNALGGVICGSAIQGSTAYVDSEGAVQLGADGPVAACNGPGSFFADTVRVRGTTGGVYVDNAIVNADLVLRGNDPIAHVGETALVRGTIRGDYEPADQHPAQRIAVPTAQQRAIRLDQRIDHRRARATADAQAAGRAHL
ncbi:MAG: hypothetical protein ACRDQA_10175, partial [Nocardioidaceae bacterium]